MKKKRKVRCAVIGLGRLGYQHTKNLLRNPDAEVVAVVDPLKAARDRAVSDFEVETTCSDYLSVMDDKRIEAVVIATPTKQHFSVLNAAIEAEKKIFVEKPITYTVEEAESISAKVRDFGAFLQVGFMRRFDPGHIAAKKMIENGEIGDPIYIHDCQRDPNGPPKNYVPESGGLFVDMGIHDIDCVRWLMNSEVGKIYAQGAVLKHTYLKELNDVDEGQILLTFANGSLADIEVSRNANDIYDVRTEIIGTKGSVYIGQNQLTPYIKVNKNGTTYDMANWCLGRFEKAYEEELSAFINCILTGQESKVSAFEGMMSLKLSKIATQSYKEEKAILVK